MNEGLTDLRIGITDDRMAVYLECSALDKNLDPIVMQIQSELGQMKILNAPQPERLRELLQAAKGEQKERIHIQLVEGRAPVPPKDGAIEWVQDFFNFDFMIDEKTGTIDYRHRVAHLTVSEGQYLARVTNPVPGQEGMDVLGKRIPVEKAKRVKLRIGANVRGGEQPDGLYLYAACTGRIRLESEALTIDKVFHVHGDVGMETGNIDFPESLVIEGDVLAGSTVKAGGDIEIQGFVEAADIEAGGNLTVLGGINSAAGKRISAGGELRAKFILNAYIEAGKDIIVEREVIQSTLNTRGSIVMPNGRLVGGESTALGNITVCQAGSEGMMKTCLVVGEDYLLAAQLEERNQKIAKLEKDLQPILQGMEPLLARKSELLPKQREVLTEMLYKSSVMEKRIDALKREKEELGGDPTLTDKAQIMIKDILYPETFLRHKNNKMRIFEAFSGPIRVLLVDGQIKILPAT